MKDDKDRLIKEYNYIPPELARIVPGQKAIGISEVGAAERATATPAAPNLPLRERDEDRIARERGNCGQKKCYLDNPICIRAHAVAAAVAATDDDTGALACLRARAHGQGAQRRRPSCTLQQDH